MRSFTRSRWLAIVASLSVIAIVLTLAITHYSNASAAPATSIAGRILQLNRVGSSTPAAGATGTNTTTQPDEIDTNIVGDDADNGGGNGDTQGVNRTLPGAKTGHGSPVKPSAKPKSNPILGTNFDGVNFFNQRFANNGNQFSIEPPDQGLCVGNGFIVESVNDVLRIYHTNGTPASGVVDLNTFYGYAPAIIRTGPNAGQRGPSITDPICLYDQVIQRFVHVVLTLDHVGKTATLNGNNHLDIAVSDTSDPTGSWTIYRLPVQNNGTDGTPDHQCALGFCLGDYPHIGADANGIYLTTNEFSTLGAGFYGAQVYGIGHKVLTGGTGGSIVLFNTLGAGPDGAGFTVWPAQTPGTQFDVTNGGSEYFLSSRAVFADDGTSTGILLWTLANSSSLNTTTPSPTLNVTQVNVDTYAVPARATQKAGNQPLSQCIADTTFPCNLTIAGTASHNNTFLGLNANDSRMQQVAYANGKVWGALDTAINVGGQDRAGIAYYAINPHSRQLVLQGQAGIANTDLTYPAIGMTESGRGVVAFTVTGDTTYPSAGYAGLDDKVGMGDVQIAAAGQGPWDGFTGYRAFGTRPRWGDYGAAAVDGNSIWITSEYVAQTCDYATYKADPTCGQTRGALSNWATHVSKVTP